MIEFLSSWAKGLGLAIVIVSILEMLLPNNKTKKYIRIVMGIYIIFNIISPFVQNKEVFSLDNIDIENYTSNQVSTNVNQTSMDERIEELYIDGLEKDITKKITEKGYDVTKCKVDAKLGSKEEESKINKIELLIKKSNKNDEEKSKEEQNIEDKILVEVQKIKTVDVKNIEDKENKDEENQENHEKQDTKITNADIQNIKKFLIDEYGVSEKCLKIN